MTNLLYKELSFDINGILFAIHNSVGKFANEREVNDEIEKLLQAKNILYIREWPILIANHEANQEYHRADFLIDGKIILEIKYKKFLTKQDYDQTKRYLNAAQISLGILVNFRDNRIYPKRILNSAGKN